jgi:hypothetical protein
VRENNSAALAENSDTGVVEQLTTAYPTLLRNNFYISGLSNLISERAAAPLLAVIGGTLIALEATLGPETRDVEMAD